VIRAPLGDSHNFGRRVSRSAGGIAKPRTLAWEWLVLSSESPLRKLLKDASAHEGMRGAFAFLPSLAFSSPHAPAGGDVEHVNLAPLSSSRSESSRTEKGRRTLAAIVGRAIALFGWLGVSDLHWENLVLGIDDHGEIIFAPLDIEMILADLSLPTETKLLPDADPEYAAICRHSCGVRRALPYLGKPIHVDDLLTLAAAYRATLAFLDAHARAIANAITSLPNLRETPIRILLRGTEDYLAPDASRWPPLLDAEKEQLARGDVPYFFRLYGRAGIHYYADESLTQIKTLPQKGDVPQLDPMLSLTRGLRSPSRKVLADEGLFVIFGAFDHPTFTGHHAHSSSKTSNGIEATFSPRRIALKVGAEDLATKRNLSAFVSSVYLPCRCGEVRSVFVPNKTICTREPGSPF
jgi:hypothetical protein